MREFDLIGLPLEEKEWRYRQMATDMSYNALKQGNFNVSKLRVSQQRSGFDLDIVNDDGSKIIIGVKARNRGKFYISREEFDALKKSSTDCNYIIHWYKFRDKKVIKFTAYKYDKELGMLVDMTDSSNVCYIREVLCDTNDAFPCPAIAIECLPKSIANDFEINWDKKFELQNLPLEEKEWRYRQMATDMSYNALNQGNFNVSKLRVSQQRGGFDLDIVNDDGSKTIIGVKASNQGKFYISREELDALKKSNSQSNYIIHWYKYRGKNVTKFTAYKYDRESGMLVDIADPSNICPIKEVFVDADGLSGVSLECLPRSIANDFEIKSSEFFGDMDYKKTARMISYNALKQGNASVEKLNKASWMKIGERNYSDFDPDSGFDIEVINGDGTKTIIGVNASPKSKFYTRPEELAAMKASNNECSYLIHRYKFSCGKVAKFYIYRYDPERNVLVDIVDPRNTCAIKEMDYCDAWWERTFEAVECTPKRKLFTFTKED